MHTEAQRGEASPLMLAVRSTEDIEFLVKESEVLTGLPGRRFVIAGADRLTYRLLWHPRASRSSDSTTGARSCTRRT